MPLPRRRFLRLAAGAVALPTLSHIARAQPYPSRPITIVVPFPTGGAATTLARLLAEHMRGSLGQAVIVENVPDRGGAPAMQDVMGGQVDFMCDMAGNSLPQVRSGSVKALAVMAKARWFAAPDVPTVDEMGVPGIHVSIWHGVWAPKGTPN